MNAPLTYRSSPSRTWFGELGYRLSTQSVIPLPLRVGMGVTAAATLVMFLGALVGMGGCQTHSEPVGHTKTVEKTVVDTPTEKTTVTETKEKKTTIDR